MNSKTQDASLRNVENCFRKHFYNPDIQGMRALYSAVAAHYLQGKPVWVFAVAVGGGGKTETLMPLQAIGAHFISSFTPQTLISGFTWRNRSEDDPERDASLLSHIKNGILVCKDFSQVLSMPSKQRGPVLADLRDVYDGYISKAFGTGERKKWTGRITFIAAVTQDLDRSYSIFQSMGERFVQVRWPRPGGVDAAIKAMTQAPAAQDEIKDAVGRLFTPITGSHQPLSEPALPDAVMRRLANLTEFAVRARTHIPRNGYTHEIVYVPEAEAATRMAQQLAQLARGSALLSGRDTVTEEDFQVARRVGMDSLPANRRRVLDSLIREPRSWSNKELQDATGLPEAVLSRLLDDLVGLGLITKEGMTFDCNDIKLSEEAMEFLRGADGACSSDSEKGTLAIEKK